MDGSRPAGFTSSIAIIMPKLLSRPAFLLLSAVLLAGCANGAEAPSGERVSLYKYHGAVQCESQGAPLSTTQAQLAGAGIRVLSASCGTDGMAHMSVCGGGTGSIHIVEVPAAQVKPAQALGWAPLSRLPDATRQPCR